MEKFISFKRYPLKNITDNRKHSGIRIIVCNTNRSGDFGDLKTIVPADPNDCGYYGGGKCSGLKGDGLCSQDGKAGLTDV